MKLELRDGENVVVELPPYGDQASDLYAGMNVVGNAVFASRTERRRVSAEQRFFDSAVYAAEMCQRQGWAVTSDTLRMVNGELPTKLLADLIESEKFQHALEERGIPLVHSKGLSPEQNAALAVFFDMSTPATLPQKLKMAGVSQSKWNGWLRQAPFLTRYNQLAEDILKGTPALALQRLHQHVDHGNIKAIELTLEMTGRHDRRKEQVDVNALLMGIFGVLDEFVDADTMRMVSDRVKQLMGGGGPVMQIAPPPTSAVDRPDDTIIVNKEV